MRLRCSDSRSLVLGAALALAAWGAAWALALSGAAYAAAPGAENEARLDRTVRFLQEVQNPDGGFGGARGEPSDPDFSAWVALALAAASINPQDQSQPGGVDVYTYLAQHASQLSATTDFERALLVVDAAGTSPQDFGGVDLPAALLARQLPDGSFPHVPGGQPGVNDTVFAVLALSPSKDPAAVTAVQRAADWLEHEQLPDGGWPSNCPPTLPGCEPQAEADLTGAAVEALNAAGRHTSLALPRAFAFLHTIQNSDGGFPERPGELESNVASTAWASEGIWSSSQNPETWIDAGTNPLAYMASLQQADGSIRFKRIESSIPVWMTAYVAPAFAGQVLPPAVVPRARRELPPPTEPARGAAGNLAVTHASESGSGGDSAGGSSVGVIAGGGGRGAPLFSRPRPQSRGRLPGARRQLESAPSTAARRIQSRSKGTSSPALGATTNRSTEEGPKPSPSPKKGEASTTVHGLLLGSPAGIAEGAPGLHGASPGGRSAAWLALAVAAACLLLVALGSLLERHRPEELV